MIVQRVQEAVFRCVFWINKGPPKSLGDLLEQEVYVKINSMQSKPCREEDFSVIENLYEKNIASTNHHLLFNFFYGDMASKLLAYTRFGVKENQGFKYADFIARKQKSNM